MEFNFKSKYIIIIGLVLLVVIIGKNFLSNNDNDDTIIDEFQSIIVEEEVVGDIYCDIKGEVVSPGVYKMKLGDRIIDLVNAAGGLKKTADTSYINLSARVSDEMVVIISKIENKSDDISLETDKKTFFVGAGTLPKPIVKNVITKDDSKTTETKTESTNNSETAPINNEVDSSSEIDNTNDNETDNNTNINNTDDTDNTNDNNSNSKININTASQSLLDSLPGIGPSKALAIINYRKDNGLFKSINEITNVSGIGDSTFDKIKNLITV